MKLTTFFSLYILLLEEHDCSGKFFGKNCLFMHKYQWYYTWLGFVDSTKDLLIGQGYGGMKYCQPKKEKDHGLVMTLNKISKILKK